MMRGIAPAESHQASIGGGKNSQKPCHKPRINCPGRTVSRGARKGMDARFDLRQHTSSKMSLCKSTPRRMLSMVMHDKIINAPTMKPIAKIRE